MSEERQEMEAQVVRCDRGGQVTWHEGLRTGVSRVFHVDEIDYVELMAFQPRVTEWLLLSLGAPMEVAGGTLELLAVKREAKEPTVTLRFVPERGEHA
ncbi:MAG TPA: hypothetical protein PKE40_00730 [Arachnia sp.]|nr:hypothetical protein [Arachnia sp.]HMT84851.1 hypothetical protein [Arachnia sp.]